MNVTLNKNGRPRLYGFTPAKTLRGGEFKNREAGMYMAALNELMERVIDQTEHLPQDAVDFVAPGTTLSVGRLMLHLSFADARMFGLLVGKKPDGSLAERLNLGALSDFSKPPEKYGSASELIALMRRVREEFVCPWCAEITDMEAPSVEKSPLKNARDTFMQMCWHWTYHSGHIGLLTLQAGYDYTWTFPE